MAWTPQVDQRGKVHYIDTEGDQGGAWDFISKHLPRAVSETWGEAVTPSLNPVGGEMNAQDYIARNAGLTNQGGESIPEALLKGAGEGALGLVVPKASADLQGSALAQGSGALLAGAGAARGAQKGAEASLAARDSARAKFKAAGNDQYLASRRAGQKVANASDPAGVANPMGKTQYRGPRPSAEDVEQFHRGTGLDRGIPPRELPELDKARTSARAWANRSDPVKGHQLKMAKYRAKREQLNEGLSKVKKEQLGEGRKAMKNEQIAEGNQRYVEDAAVDKVQQDIAGRYLYNRARNAPVDSAGTAARNAPPPPKPREMPAMGTADDLAQMVQDEESARAAAQQNNLLPQLKNDMPQGGSSFLEYMQELLSRGSISEQDFMALMRAKAQESGSTGPGGQGLPF